MAEAVPAGVAYVEIRPGPTTGVKTAIANVAGAAGRSAEKTIAASMAAGFATAGKKTSAAGAALTKSLTLPLLAVGAFAFKAAKDYEDGLATIRVGTGATGKALDSLGKSFERVNKTVPNATADVATAIADLNTRTGRTGKSLESLATQELNLARITKTDLGANIAATSRLFRDWSVPTKKQSLVLDELFRASQSTGISLTTLSQKVVQFGSPLRQLGFNFEQTVALFSEFERAGVVTETVLPGLKNGLKNFAKAGKDPQEMLTKTIKKIKEANTTAKANSIAFKVFGARAGPDLAAAIREGHFNLDELMKTISGGPDTINKAAKASLTFSDKLSLLGKQAEAAVLPLGQKLLDALTKALPTFTKMTTKVQELVQKFNSATPATQRLITKILLIALVAGPLLKIAGFFLTLIGRVIKFGIAIGRAVIGVVRFGIAVTKGIVSLIQYGRYLLFAARYYITIGAQATIAAARTIAFAVAQRVAAAASKAWAIATALLSLAMKALPIFFIITALVSLVAGVIYAYKHFEIFRTVVNGVFSWLKNAVVATIGFVASHWKLIVSIILGPFGIILVQIISHWKAISNAFSAAIRATVSFVKSHWQYILLGIIAAPLLPIVILIKHHWATIKSVFTTVANQVLSKMRSFRDGVKSAFTSAVNGVKTIWDRMKGIAKSPVNFVIGTVYNNGIVRLWNTVMGWLHLNNLKLGKIGLLASGGTFNDIQPGVFNRPTAIVGEGNPRYPEYVIPTDPKYRGRAQALWQAAGGNLQMMQGGGILGSVLGGIKSAASKVGSIVKAGIDLLTNPSKVWDALARQFVPSGSAISGNGPIGMAISKIPPKMLEHIKGYALKVFKAFDSGYAGGGRGVIQAARKWLGTPYSWGGGGLSGPSHGIGRGANTVGFDCSGLTQYAWGKGGKIDIGGTTYAQIPRSHHIAGPKPGSLIFPHPGHVMLASDKPGYVIQAPHTGAFVEEVRRTYPFSGIRWPNAAHFARGGTLERQLGNKFTKSRTRRWDVAKYLGIAGDPGGFISGYGPQVPLHLFDSGGIMEPRSIGMYANATRFPEVVLNRSQMRTVSDVVHNGGGDVHYHLHASRANVTVQDLEALQARQTALARAGRPR